MVIGLISRLTNQKGLDLVNDVIPGIMDEHTQVVVLGTGDSQYENTFRYYENKYKGNFCAYIAYNENVAHNIYAGCDALLVPSRFEPCGLTQLIAMRYGAVPIVRETGGLKIRFSLIICLRIQETVLHLTDMKAGCFTMRSTEQRLFISRTGNPGMIW